MKAVLVIDMPKCCAECPLMLWDAESEYYGACCPTLKEVNCVAESYKENENKGTKPNWCPLKSLPLEQKVRDSILPESVQGFNEGWKYGWNACIDAIEGKYE